MWETSSYQQWQHHFFTDPDQEIGELMKGKLNDLRAHIDSVWATSLMQSTYITVDTCLAVPAEASISAQWTIKWTQDHFYSGEAGQQKDNEQEAAIHARAATAAAYTDT